MKSDAEAARIMADPGTSRWLYHAVRTALGPPIEEVVRDCEFLANFLARRLAEGKEREKMGR
jgi:hypothetical protein